MIYISPSILACDFTTLGEQVAAAKEGGADMIHVDVMDGIFVPNISIGFPVIKSLSARFSIPLDVHLMIVDPEKYIDAAADSGADGLTFHLEATDSPERIIKKIREKGMRPSVSVKPGTPIESVYPYLNDLEMVLIMTVEPGFGGQKIMPETIEKVTKLREHCNSVGLEGFKIEVDGGIGRKNIRELVNAGANVIVMGSAVFGESNIPTALKELRATAEL